MTCKQLRQQSPAREEEHERLILSENPKEKLQEEQNHALGKEINIEHASADLEAEQDLKPKKIETQQSASKDDQCAPEQNPEQIFKSAEYHMPNEQQCRQS